MNNEKSHHTPGPWAVADINDDPSLPVICAYDKTINGGWEIATPHGPDYEANARLIAAAPELLDIAHRWMTWATGPVVPIAVRMQLQEDTRAATAKAEGKS